MAPGELRPIRAGRSIPVPGSSSHPEISMCRLPLLIALSAAVASAEAQAPTSDKPKTGGVLVKGWTGQIDDAGVRAGLKLSDATFEADGAGFKVTAGPAAYYWNPANVAKGRYAVSATFTQRAPTAKPEAYGIFIGGSSLGKSDRNYLYCVVFGTGIYSVKHQFGSENHTLVNLKPHAALRKADAEGRATNEVGWRVSDERVSCVINGVEVESFKRADVLGPGKLESTDGVYGLRVNHNLEVQVTGLQLTKLP
jgi:hypothetical protein